MSSTRQRSEENPIVAERVRARTADERSRRLLLRGVMIVLIAAAMLFASLANREQQARRGSARLAEAIAAELQVAFHTSQDPPLELPDLGERHRGYRDLFLFNFFYADDAKRQGVSGVCAPREPLSLLLREDGRHVVVFAGDRYRVEWLTEAQFRKQAPGLGFGSLLR